MPQEPKGDLAAPRLRSGETRTVRAETRLAADTYTLALRPEITAGLTAIEVSARRPDGSTEILLFARDPPIDWPTPYIFRDPVFLPVLPDDFILSHFGVTVRLTAAFRVLLNRAGFIQYSPLRFVSV